MKATHGEAPRFLREVAIPSSAHCADRTRVRAYPKGDAMTFILGMVAGALIVMGLIFAVWAFSEPLGPKF
jgi:hypothetical protein